MAGSIFVIDPEDKVVELKETKYENEDFFQTLIEKYPSILGGDQMTPDNPRKWIFVSREMGVPSKQEGSSQWFLDHLFIDQDGIPTFIEVKRSTDTRVRREVVAQMLDYAANATVYWPISGIRLAYESHDGDLTSDLDLNQENEEGFWELVDSNLRLGKIRLLFVADEIPSSLQRIIEFLNGQMIHTEVLGVEIKQFTSASNVKTLVPRIIGQTLEAVEVKNRTAGQWDEESLLSQIEIRSGRNAAETCKIILEKLVNMGCRIWWGRGKKHASCTVVFDGKKSYPLFSIYPFTKSTVIEIQFQNFKEPFNTDEKRKEVQHKLQMISGVFISEDKLNKRPSFDWSILKSESNLNQFVEVFEWMIKEIERCSDV